MILKKYELKVNKTLATLDNFATTNVVIITTHRPSIYSYYFRMEASLKPVKYNAIIIFLAKEYVWSKMHCSDESHTFDMVSSKRRFERCCSKKFFEVHNKSAIDEFGF